MIVLLLAFLLAPVQAMDSLSPKKDVLPIYVFELRPLIYQDENKVIKGDWYESFEMLSHASDVTFQYQFVSIPRLELLLASTRSGCNLTLVKTKTRMEKGKINFIYDHPIDSVFKIYQRVNDERVWDLKKIQNTKDLKIITNTPVGMEALKEKGVKSADLLFNINSIVHMLMMKRIDLFAGSHLAVETMDEFKSGQLKPVLTLKTFHHGIGCSRATPPEIIAKIKKGAKGWML